MKSIVKAALLSATVLAGASAANAASHSMLDDTKTIAENAMKVANFTTLVAAVEAAGLAPALMAEGPYTVFAPTNDAFVKLGATADELMLPENREQLDRILKAHVVPGIITSEDINRLMLQNPGGLPPVVNSIKGEVIEVDTLSQTDLEIRKEGSNVYVSSTLGGTEEDIQVIQADIMNSNGVIHVIDGVLVPGM